MERHGELGGFEFLWGMPCDCLEWFGRRGRRHNGCLVPVVDLPVSALSILISKWWVLYLKKRARACKKAGYEFLPIGN